MKLGRKHHCLDDGRGTGFTYASLGDIVECDICGRFWECVRGSNAGARWNTLSRRKARRLLADATTLVEPDVSDDKIKVVRRKRPA